MKKKDYDKKIQEAENSIIKQRNNNSENESKRLADKSEYDEKVQSATNELKFLNKSKNLVTKNIKNADDRIETLKQASDKLRTEKLALTYTKTELQKDVDEYEEKLRYVDPEFVRNLNQSMQGK